MEPFTTNFTESYFQNVRKLEMDSETGHIAWVGTWRVTPKKLVPIIAHIGVFYDAALIAFAITHNLDTVPIKDYRFACGEQGCMNGYHIRLYNAQRTGRKHGINDPKKIAMLTRVVTDYPTITAEEILRRLRRLGMGFKDSTFYTMHRQVRKSLGLPEHPVGRGGYRPTKNSKDLINE